MTETPDWPRFCQIIHSHQRFLLTSHIRPDCDALGSELGMAAILEQLGKDVRIVNGHETPPTIAFIDPDRRIEVIGKQVTAPQLTDREVVMILDTSAWVQLGLMADAIRSLPSRRLVVDHHVSADDLGAELFKDTGAEATGRLVIDAADALQVPLTPVSATPLYAAVATDTGWFRFQSATAATYRATARLIDAGANPATIYRNLYEQDTVGRVRLRGVILSRTEVEQDGRLAYTYVQQEDFQRTGALPSDTEDAINMVLAIKGVEFAAILVEQSTGGFKISFRSRCALDCSRLAEHFSGGGHKAAAGGYVAGKLEVALPSVLQVVRVALEALNPGT